MFEKSSVKSELLFELREVDLVVRCH